MSDEAVNSSESLLSFAAGLRKWLRDEERWAHFWDDAWVPISQRLEELDQKTHFQSALTRILAKASALGGVLSSEHERISALAERADRLIETKKGELKWPSFCLEYREERPHEDVTPSLHEFEKRLLAFRKRLEDIANDPNVRKIDAPPRLNEADRMIARYIIENPGRTGIEIINGLEKRGKTIRHDSFRKKISRKLKFWGFHNPKDSDGYFPPDRKATHYKRLMLILSQDMK